MTLALRAAVVQLTSGTDVGKNLANTRRQVSAAAAHGAHLVALPDCFAFVGPTRGRLAMAEYLERPGVVLNSLSELARRNRIYLIGTLLTRAPNGRVRNTAVLFEPGGSLTAVYHKAHLRAGTEEDEIHFLEPGNAVVTARAFGTRIGLAVSDDLRAPELFRHLAGRGASLIVAPAAMTEPFHRYWQVLVRARAYEAGSFVIAAAQAAPAPRGEQGVGGSCIVDPFGDVLADIPRGDGFVLADIKLDRVREAREAMKLARVMRSPTRRGRSAQPHSI